MAQDLSAFPEAEAGAGKAKKKSPGDPAALAPIVSQEIDPSNLVYGPAPKGQDQPAVAFDGDNYLVVWIDERDSPAEVTRIFAARVSESGEVIDRNGIEVGGYGYRPRVAFDGTNYLVVWQGADYVWGARVSPAGQVLDPGGFVISDGLEPKVVFDGTSYFVTWSRSWSDAGVHGARVSTEGAVLDPYGIPLVITDAIEVSLQEVGSDGEGVLLTWPQGGDLLAARIDQGVLLDPGGFLVATTAVDNWRSPAVGFDGANYTVAWIADYGQSPSVAAARVSPAGVVLDPEGIPLSDAPAQSWSGLSAVFDGTNTIVTWNALEPSIETDVVAARLSPAGEVLDPGGVLVTTQGGPLAAARGNAGLLVVNRFQDGWPGWPHVYGTRIDGNLATIGATEMISTAVARQFTPAVTFDGQNFVTVWSDARLLTHGIYASRVTPWGDVLDPEGIAVGDDGVGWDYDPTAIFDGTNTVVFWKTSPPEGYNGSLRAARLSPGGVALDPAPIELPAEGSSSTQVAAASDGESTLVVVDHGWGSEWLGDLRAMRLGSDGALLSPLPSSAPGETISLVPLAATGALQDPTLHFDGANYLLTWLASEGGAHKALHGARLSPEGALLDDPAGFVISDVAAGGNVVAPAEMVQLGANTLVVWPEDRNGTISLHGVEVSPAGAVLSPQSIAIGGEVDPWGGEQSWFRSAFDVVDEGERALVVWRDVTNVANPDIWGTRVAPGGVVEAAFVVSADPGREASPRAASNGLGRSLVAYHRPAEAESEEVQVKARLLTSPGCSYGPAGAGSAGAGAAAAPFALLALGVLARRERRAAARRS